MKWNQGQNHRPRQYFLLIGILVFGVCSVWSLNCAYAQNETDSDADSGISMGETAAESEALEEAVARKKSVAEAKKEAAGGKKRTIVESLGPRKGRVRDAGKFQIEMLTRKSGIDVYLVNLEGQDPAVKSSNLEGNLYIDKKEYPLRFWPNRRRKRFFAKWPKGLDAKGKKISLVLLPTRKRIVGAPVVYKLRTLY